MSPTSSEALFAWIAETVAGGESSYARLRAGGQLVLTTTAAAGRTEVGRRGAACADNPADR